MILSPNETAVILPFKLRDEDGAILTGILFDDAGLVAEYRRSGEATWTAIAPLVSATLGTWTNKGFKEDSHGLYELGFPDGLISASNRHVIVRLRGVATMEPSELRIDVLGVPRVTAGTHELGVGGGLPTLAVGPTGENPMLEQPVTVRTASVAVIALAVWNVLTAALTTVGSIGKFLIDKLGMIGTSPVTVVATVSGRQFPIYKGAAYSVALGNQLDFPFTNLPNLTGGACQLRIFLPNQDPVVEVAGTIVDPGMATQTLRFELTDAQTGNLLPPALYSATVLYKLSGGSVYAVAYEAGIIARRK